MKTFTLLESSFWDFFSVCFKSPFMDWQIPPANFYSRDRFSGCFSMVISSGRISRCFPNDFETILEDNYDFGFFLLFVLPRNILFMTFTFMSKSYFNSYSFCIILAVVVNIWLPWHLKIPVPLTNKRERTPRRVYAGISSFLQAHQEQEALWLLWKFGF